MKRTVWAERIRIHRAALLVLVLGFACRTAADTVTWDAGGGDKNWSTFANWSDNADPSGDDVKFIGTGTSSGSDPTSIINQDFTVNSLAIAFSASGGKHMLRIDGGRTLSVTGGSGGYAWADTNDSDSGTMRVFLLGDGLLTINSPANDFLVGFSNTDNEPGSLSDYSALADFNATVDEFKVGYAVYNTTPNFRGDLALPKTSTIIANSIAVGDQTNAVAGAYNRLVGILRLGSISNTVHANSIYIGRCKSSGTLNFRTAGSTLKIRAKNGSGRANMEVGHQHISSSAYWTSGTVNLTGGVVDALLGTLVIGKTAGGLGGTGAFTFNAGTVDATNVVVGSSVSSSPDSQGITGTLTVGGGTLAVGTLTLGNRTSTLAVSGIVNLVNGTIRATTIQGGTGAAVRKFNWLGGTIQNTADTNLTIASAIALTLTNANTHTFCADASRTITVNSVIQDAASGVGGITKTGAGTLVLAGANTYAGSTVVSNGTLQVTGSIASTNWQVGSGAILKRSNVNLAGKTLTIDASGTTPGILSVSGNLTQGGQLTVLLSFRSLGGKIAECTGTLDGAFESVTLPDGVTFLVRNGTELWAVRAAGTVIAVR